MTSLRSCRRGRARSVRASVGVLCNRRLKLEYLKPIWAMSCRGGPIAIYNGIARCKSTFRRSITWVGMPLANMHRSQTGRRSSN